MGRMIFKNKYLIICFAILGLQYGVPLLADIYKCKSAGGEISYSSKKCSGIPEFFNLKKEKVSQQLTGADKLSVDIYITSWCPYCKKAMAYMEKNNIAFNAYDIEQDDSARAKKYKLDPSYSGVPLTVINGKILKGFSPRRFEKALNL